jgi:hypothetical protein
MDFNAFAYAAAVGTGCPFSNFANSVPPSIHQQIMKTILVEIFECAIPLFMPTWITFLFILSWVKAYKLRIGVQKLFIVVLTNRSSFRDTFLSPLSPQPVVYVAHAETSTETL